MYLYKEMKHVSGQGQKGQQNYGGEILSVVYIAGPITEVKCYQRNFAAAEWRLSEDGHIVFNPATMPTGLEYEKYMPICYAMMDACDTVYFLTGWRNSIGACMEYEYALARKMDLLFEEAGR